MNSNLPFHQKLGKATTATIGLDALPKAGPPIPDRTRILFDRRMTIGETENDILKPIKEKVDELVREETVLNGTTRISEEDIGCWTGRKLRTRDFFPSWLIKETNIVQKALKSLWERGFHANTHVWRFSTDGVYTYGLRGIPTVGIGPGNETLAHQPNEHVHVRDVKKVVQAYLAIVEKFIS